MKTSLVMSATTLVCALAACDTVETVDPEKPTILDYTSPELSGLMPIRAFPHDYDICQLLGESEFTEPLEREDRALIACPKHEEGAIADRRRGGAKVVGNATHWVILSIPDSWT